MGIPNAPPSPMTVGLNDSFDGASLGGLPKETDYPFVTVEDYIIKFLIEKAVAMREVPFMKATEALEFSSTLSKVQAELTHLLPRESKRG